MAKQNAGLSITVREAQAGAVYFAHGFTAFDFKGGVKYQSTDESRATVTIDFNPQKVRELPCPLRKWATPGGSRDRESPLAALSGESMIRPRRSFILVFILSSGLGFSGCYGNDGWFDQRPDPQARIPYMERPVLDARLSPDEWADALRLTGFFDIPRESIAGGRFPFELRLGVDSERLYMMLNVTQIRDNPYSGVDPDSGHYQELPEHFGFFFNSDSDILISPADWIKVGVVRGWGNTIGDGYFDPIEFRWENQAGAPSAGFSFNDGLPDGGRWARAGWSNDTYFVEASIPRRSADPVFDGLDLADGTVFRLLLSHERQCPRSKEIDEAGSYYFLRCPHATYPDLGADATRHATGWYRLGMESPGAV